MTTPTLNLPLLIEATDLLAVLDHPDVLIIDLGSSERYQRAHIKNAIHVEPGALMCGIPPAMGKLPSQEQLSALFSRVGLTPKKHVVVYDDEGGGWAGRMIWTLDVIGHTHYSYLNGGMVMWFNEGYPLDNSPMTTQKTNYVINALHTQPVAELEDVLRAIHDTDTVIWDARSKEEYDGKKMLAQKAGHIPGAIHFEWTQAMDPNRYLRVKDLSLLREKLNRIGINADKNIITHCQSHHRSGFTYLVGKLLGFRIKGYHGSWSEWGNNPATPVEMNE